MWLRLFAMLHFTLPKRRRLSNGICIRLGYFNIISLIYRLGRREQGRAVIGIFVTHITPINSLKSIDLASKVGVRFPFSPRKTCYIEM